MGNCLQPQDSFVPPKIFDDFYYVCRNVKYLLRISSDIIHKFKYDNSIKIRNDSGVGYLNDGRILLAGGTDNSGCLTNKAYILDPAQSKATILPNMPISTKEGNLFHYKDFVYVIGALKDSDDEEILCQEQSAPIMRYYLTTGQWEIFDEEKPKHKNFQHLIKKSSKNVSPDDDDQEISYKSILYPGCFMIGSKVYLICGQRMSSRGILETFNEIFSIDLEEEGFDFKSEDFQLPLKVFRPICGSYKKTAFVTGGIQHTGKHTNKKSILIDFNESPPTYIETRDVRLDLDDSYPIVGSEKYFYCLAHPNLAIFDTEEKVWLEFKIEQNFINRRDVKYQTPVFASDAVGGKASIKNTVKMTFMDKKVKIVTDDVPSGESLSNADVSMNVNLPPGLILGYDEVQTKKDKDDSSDSSGQFSAERMIEIPEALRLRDSESSSVPDFQAEDVVEQQMPKKEEGRNVSFSKSFSEESSLFFAEADGIGKILGIEQKVDFGREREDVDSESSKSFASSHTPAELKPVHQRQARLAPIQQAKKFQKQDYSMSSSSSESFEYESVNKSFSK